MSSCRGVKRKAFVSLRTKPTDWYSCKAASRDDREVRSSDLNSRSVANVVILVSNNLAMPLPRMEASTTTSSTWPRKPVGSGTATNVAVPTIFPSRRATRSSVASCSTTASRRPRSNVVVVESWPRSRARSSTSSDVRDVRASISGSCPVMSTNYQDPHLLRLLDQVVEEQKMKLTGRLAAQHPRTSPRTHPE